MEKREKSASLQAFAGELEQYEMLIAKEFKSFRKGRKLWGKILSLTAAEKQKAFLIQEFVFPGDPESMMEALLYVKSQMAALASECSNRKTWYWAHLWKERAEQLYEKVKILTRENTVASQVYAEIVRNEKKIKNSARLRVLLTGGVILAALSVILILFSVPERKEDRIIAIHNFTFSVPLYWGEEGSRPDYYQYYRRQNAGQTAQEQGAFTGTEAYSDQLSDAEADKGVIMLSIACPIDDDLVTLDALYADNENMIQSLESWFPVCQVTKYEDFQSDDGVKGILYSYQAIINIEGTDYEVSGKCFCFPSVEDNRWFFVVVNSMDNPSWDYEEDYMELLASIRQTIH